MSHVNGPATHQPHMTIDSHTAISTRFPVLRVQTNGQYILSLANIRGKIHAERVISVRPSPYIATIEPHFRVSHGSIEVHVKTFAPFLVYEKCFRYHPIP